MSQASGAGNASRRAVLHRPTISPFAFSPVRIGVYFECACETVSSEMGADTVTYALALAPTGRAACKKCGKTIESGAPRVTVSGMPAMLTRLIHDNGHYHLDHAFEARFKSSSSSRWNPRLVVGPEVSAADARRARARLREAERANATRARRAQRDSNLFVVAHAPTDRAHCKACKKHLPKGKLRVTRTLDRSSGPFELHFCFEDGMRGVARVKCDAATPPKLDVGDLGPADAKRVRASFAKAMAIRAKRC